MSNFLKRIPGTLKKFLNDWSYAMEKSFEYNYMVDKKVFSSPKKK